MILFQFSAFLFGRSNLLVRSQNSQFGCDCGAISSYQWWIFCDKYVNFTNLMLHRILLPFSLMMVTSSWGVVFDLDFSGASAIYDETQKSLRIEIEDVAVGVGAPDIDLVIESINDYNPDTAQKGMDISAGGNNGTPVGTDDFKIHLDIGTQTQFRFSLYDGANGQFDTAYNPGTSYSFSLVAYDIDGGTGSNFDELLIYSPVEYTLTSTSPLDVTETPTYIGFSGEGTGEVLGQDGVTSFLPEQEDVAVALTFSNLSTFVFEYRIPGTVGTGSGRNQLFDGDDLAVSGTPIDYVPETNAFSLTVGMVAFISLARRRRN